MDRHSEQLLQQKNIKITANRLLVLEVFLQKDFALSLVDIEKELPWADRATLFRTLKTFQEKALIHLIDDGSKAQKYALCSDHCEVGHHHVHPHFHCNQCGKTICLTEKEIALPELPAGFQVQSISMVINGLCEACNF